jgi:hypothetical protein
VVDVEWSEVQAEALPSVAPAAPLPVVVRPRRASATARGRGGAERRAEAERICAVCKTEGAMEVPVIGPIKTHLCTRCIDISQFVKGLLR